MDKRDRKDFVSSSSAHPLNISVQQDTKWHNKTILVSLRDKAKSPLLLAWNFCTTIPARFPSLPLQVLLFRVLNDERGCHGNHSQVKEVVFPSALLQGASKSPIKVVTAVIASSPCPVRSRGRQRRCPINPRSLLLTETLCFTQSHNKSAVPSV